MDNNIDEENWLSQLTKDTGNLEDLELELCKGPCIVNGYIKKDCPLIAQEETDAEV